MKNRIMLHVMYFLALGLLFGGAVALAGSVSVPNTFTAGTTARAGEVNANFSAVESEVNDNDSRITTNASDIATNAADIAANASDVAAHAADIATNAADIATNASDIATNAAAIATNTADIAGNAADIANIVSITIPRMWAQVDVTDYPVVGVSSVPVETNRVTIDAPSDGFIVISGSVVLVNLDVPQIYALVPYVDGFPVPVQVSPPGAPNNQAAGYFTTLPPNPASEFTLSYTLAVPVPAGLHDVWQTAGPLAAPAPMNFFYDKNYLTVVFYPSTHGEVTDAPLDDTFGVF